ncbi:putative sporulation protein YtxC [Melghirimyces algeriensis]|uniref:Putative sporulation protein YtxC n=1 Tax=Melghirimyces algeriensis TaxID=910412 RepID=A0A521AI02_9BACL|nr:putative sporulation protein YtxC [Melghirimyces algeriensis]SMO34464.1 putative sporulation protein YtxC [Melghirimyces algeriensis]
MPSYRISVPGPRNGWEADQMRVLLRAQLKRMGQTGLDWDIEEIRMGNRTVFLLFNHNRKKRMNGEKEIQKSLGMTVAEYIVTVNEPHVIRKIIQRVFHFRHPDDSRKIEQYALHLLDDSEADEPPYRKRKERMARQVMRYLNQHHVLAVDGFFHFRLKHYRDGLIRLVEHAVDEFLLEQEYREFIELLRYFVSIQQPKCSLVHVLHIEKRQFRLLDRKGDPLQLKDMGSIAQDLLEQPFSHEDLIVSTLLTVAPKQVVLHTQNPEENVIRTLEQVFESRMTLCDGCSSCLPHLRR